MLEVLVALSITALLWTLITNGMSFSAAAWRKSDELSQKIADLQTSHAILRRIISNSIPIALNKQNILSFEGGQNKLIFVVSSLAHLDTAGLKVVTLEKKPDTDGSSLYLSWSYYNYRQFPPVKKQEALLLPEINSLVIKYYGFENSKSQRRKWLPSWKNRDILPNMVSINIDRSYTDSIRWPELLVSLKQSPKPQ